LQPGFSEIGLARRLPRRPDRTPARCPRSRRKNSPGWRRARCLSRMMSTVQQPSLHASGSCRRASRMSAYWRVPPAGRNTTPAATVRRS